MKALITALALVTLAATRVAMPVWLRWATLLLGVIGLASPAFFPSLALLIWGVLSGVWLLAGGARAATASNT